tara:strand:- start:175 stop:831 length:657 start_codon:yes stop_codon:yes gene_type:complete
VHWRILVKVATRSSVAETGVQLSEVRIFSLAIERYLHREEVTLLCFKEAAQPFLMESANRFVLLSVKNNSHGEIVDSEHTIFVCLHFGDTDVGDKRGHTGNTFCSRAVVMGRKKRSKKIKLCLLRKVQLGSSPPRILFPPSFLYLFPLLIDSFAAHSSPNANFSALKLSPHFCKYHKRKIVIESLAMPSGEKEKAAKTSERRNASPFAAISYKLFTIQ